MQGGGCRGEGIGTVILCSELMKSEIYTVLNSCGLEFCVKFLVTFF